LKTRKPADPADRFFASPWVDAHYRPRAGQGNAFLRVPAMQWRGHLRRISPRMARYLAGQGILIEPRQT